MTVGFSSRARLLALGVWVGGGCAHAGNAGNARNAESAAQPDARALDAWQARFRQFAASLPVCPSDLPAQMIEEAWPRSRSPGECLLLRGRLVLLAEAPPCDLSDSHTQFCWVGWAIRDPSLPPARTAAAARLRVAVGNGAGDDSTGACEHQVAGARWLPRMARASLPYPAGDRTGSLARAARSELAVAALAAMPDPGPRPSTPLPMSDAELPDSPRYQPPELPADYGLATSTLEVTHLCRLE